MVAKGEDLAGAAKDLGLAGEEALLRRQADLKTEIGRAFSTKTPSQAKGVLATLLTLAIQANPSAPPDPAVFEPSRKAEYALVERVLAWGVAAVAGLVALGVLVERQRRDRRVRGLAEGLAPLLRARDFAWIWGLGLGLPLAAYAAIAHGGSPLGCRDIGLGFYGWAHPLVLQMTAAGLLTLTLTVQTVRWRLAKRMGFLGLGQAGGWAWAPVVTAALVLVLCGVVRWLPGDGKVFLQALGVSLSGPLLWLLWRAGLAVSMSSDRALGGALVVRPIFLPLIALGFLALGASEAHRWAERRWYLRDEVVRPDFAAGGVSRWEAQATEWMAEQYRKEFPPPGEGS